ncbi:MAG: hypothetical protein K2G29_07165, partial [Muribaculaceae bacterium]|nr:hypothetical protein [Muribaculaceae bacterium]
MIDSVRPNLLWDFRNAEKTEDFLGASYILYGDSLLSETVDDQRRWYAISSDTLMLVREESFGYSYLPDTIICTSSFNNVSN